MTDILIYLLDVIQGVTGVEPQPFQTEKYGKNLPAITYSFYTMTDSGAVASYRLLVRVHGSTYEQCVSLTDSIRKALVTVGDEYRNGCSITGNGGGSLIDNETGIPQQISYFDITTRS